MKTAPDDPELPLDSSEAIIAHFTWPSQQLIRLRATRDTIDTLGDWEFIVEAVEGTHMMDGIVTSDDKSQVTLQKTNDYDEAKAFYNTTVEPLLETELEAAHDVYNEAVEIGDTIEAMNAERYINDLENELNEIPA